MSRRPGTGPYLLLDARDLIFRLGLRHFEHVGEQRLIDILCFFYELLQHGCNGLQSDLLNLRFNQPHAPLVWRLAQPMPRDGFDR
jgi:hypothetical protein